MLTRFGSKVTACNATDSGWIMTERENGEYEEIHINDLIVEGIESAVEKAAIERAMSEAEAAGPNPRPTKKEDSNG